VQLDQNGSGPRQVICESLAPNSIDEQKNIGELHVDQSSTLFFFHSFDKVLVLSSVAGTLFFIIDCPFFVIVTLLRHVVQHRRYDSPNGSMEFL